MKAKPLEVFRLVLDESLRIANLHRDGKREEANAETDLWTDLQREHGSFPRKGHYESSKKAVRALHELCKELIHEDRSLRGQIHVGTLFTPLKTELAIQCIDGRRKLDGELAKEMMDTAKAIARQSIVSETYYFPVYCIDDHSTDAFEIGPVHLIKTGEFFKKEEVAWKRSITESVTREQTNEESLDHESHLLNFFERAKQVFHEFPWIAYVKIDSCEHSIGEERAKEMIELAMASIRILLSSHNDDYIGHAAGSNTLKSGIYMKRDAKGTYHPTIAHHWGGIPVVEGFINRAKESLPYFKSIEEALEIIRIEDESAPSIARLMDALRWYGEACKDQYDRSRLIKFATCLEVLFSTGAREGLTELLAERVALFGYNSSTDRLKAHTQVREVYHGRSKAVHGDKLKGKTYEELCYIASELACASIATYAHFLPVLFRVPQKQLEQVLSDFFKLLKMASFDEAMQFLHSKVEEHA